MATLLTTWEQSAQFDPLNPAQRVYTRYAAVPGGYASFYYNQVPTTAKLAGALGMSTLPSWAQAGLVGLAGLAIGFFGWHYAGPPIKRKLGLSGARRRRR